MLDGIEKGPHPPTWGGGGGEGRGLASSQVPPLLKTANCGRESRS